MASGSSPGAEDGYIPPDLYGNTGWANAGMIVNQSVDGSFAGRRLPEWMDPVNGELSILVMAPVEGNTLPDNPWLISRSIEKAVGPIEDARPEAKGSRYVLKVRQAKQVHKLLNLSELVDGTKVSVGFHQTLNVRKCTVSCPYGLSMSDNEMLEELRSQRVIEFKRFLRKDLKNKDNLIPTSTCLITVQGTTIPEFFHFGYIRVRTRPFYPSPLQCANCHRFSHTKRNCKEKQICSECSLEHEPKTPCLAVAHCINCKGPHSSRARECSVKKAEMCIVRIKIDEDVSYPEARRLYDSRLQNSCVQERLDNPKVDHLLKMLEQKDEEIGKLRQLLEKLINEVADLKKEKAVNMTNAMETDVKQDLKSTKRRSNSNPTSPNANRMAPPTKKLLEHGINSTKIDSGAPPQAKMMEFERTDISPIRDIN